MLGDHFSPRPLPPPANHGSIPLEKCCVYDLKYFSFQIVFLANILFFTATTYSLRRAERQTHLARRSRFSRNKKQQRNPVIKVFNKQTINSRTNNREILLSRFSTNKQNQGTNNRETLLPGRQLFPNCDLAGGRSQVETTHVEQHPRHPLTMKGENKW